MKNPTTSERTSDRELVVTRTFNAPARIVFEAWTRPELFTRWWVPKSTGMSLLSCEMDVRVGVHTGWWLGRRPDHRPMPTLLQWELSDKGGLMLSAAQRSPPGARSSSMSRTSPPSAAAWTGWGSHSAKTMTATIRRWRRSAIRTAT